MPDNVEVSPDGRSSTYKYGGAPAAPSAAELVDRALERMSKEIDPFAAAGNLIERWCEQDSSLRHLLTDAMNELDAREKRTQVEAGPTKRSTRLAVGPRIGDFALMESGIGPSFYEIRKIHVDGKGRLFAVSLSAPGSPNIGQAIAIERVTAVFANILNAEE